MLEGGNRVGHIQLLTAGNGRRFGEAVDECNVVVFKCDLRELDHNFPSDCLVRNRRVGDNVEGGWSAGVGLDEL